MPPSAMNTMRPQQPMSAIVQVSPTSQLRPASALSMKASAASASGRKCAMTAGSTVRKRLKWRTRATFWMASASQDSHSRACQRSCSLAPSNLPVTRAR